MRNFKIAVIAGTSEATDFINMLPDIYDVTAFAATEQGKKILEDTKCSVCVGRLNEIGFTGKLKNFDAVADLSHPFAVVVSDTVKKVCLKLEIPYFRAGREHISYDYEKIIYVNSKEDAADYLEKYNGNILFTTGVNTLSFYENRLKDKKDKIWARILDTDDSRKIAYGSELNIIYALPPFSENDTSDILEKYNIGIMVSKDSGKRGGLDEKIKAAEKNSVSVLIIKSPENGIVQTMEEILIEIEKLRKGEKYAE